MPDSRSRTSLVALTVLFLTFSFPARALEISFPWSCPHTAGLDVPDDRIITVSFGEVEPSQLSRIERINMAAGQQAGGPAIVRANMGELTEITLDLRKGSNEYQSIDSIPCLTDMLIAANTALFDEFCPGSEGGEGCEGDQFQTLFRAINAEINNTIRSVATNSDDRILTPFSPGESSSPPLGEEQIQQMVEELVEDCGKDLSSPAESYLDGAILDGLSQRSGLESGCLEELSHFFARTLGRNAVHDRRRCSGREEVCQRRDREVISTMLRLEQMGMSDFSPVSDERLAALCSEEFSTGSEAFTDLLGSSELASGCVSLGVGESRVAPDSGALNSRYTLRRLDNIQRGDNTVSNHEVIVDLNILDDTDDVLITRARQCFTLTNPYMRGPGGEQLALRLYDDLSVQEQAGVPKPSTHDISITPPGARANSSAWPSTINCPTIIHEVLHVLGLCDEYEENAMGRYMNEEGQVVYIDSVGSLPAEQRSSFIASFDCRSLGPEDSVMREQDRAFSNISMGETCVCPEPKGNRTRAGGPEDEAEQQAARQCREALQNFDPSTDQCPGNVSDALLAFSFRTTEEGELVLASNTESMVIYNQPDEPSGSYLLPAHFRHIIAMGCPIGRRDFIFCQGKAYSSSSETISCDPEIATRCQGEWWNR